MLAAGYVEQACAPTSNGANCLSYGVMNAGLQGLGYMSEARAATLSKTLSTRKKQGSSSPIGGYAPADLQSAYGINPSGGSGKTVAVVEAGDAPQLEGDMGVYRSQYGLPSCTSASGCFKVLNQSGTSSPLPAANVPWSQESTLDVEMISALCPNCHIIVVEANSNAWSDLAAAENTAAGLNPTAISNSFGGTGSNPYESAYNHPGIAIFVSAGDGGYLAGAATPASFPEVISVGGTTLTKSSNARGWTDAVWDSTESACSSFPKPSWQTDTGCSGRTVADVAFDADPATGVALYFSPTITAPNGVPWGGGWVISSGTSIGSPAVAAIYALANCVSNTASFLYTYASKLTDVTTGSSTGCSGCAPTSAGIDAGAGSGSGAICSASYLCNAEVGYDAPSGNGVPNGLAAFQAPCVIPTPTPTPTCTASSSTSPNPHPTQNAVGGTCTS
jgi:subtilase family serine protease